MSWNNFVTTPHRWMARYLRRRGWVCFYLEPHNRPCRALCWMDAFEQSEGRSSTENPFRPGAPR